MYNYREKHRWRHAADAKDGDGHPGREDLRNGTWGDLGGGGGQHLKGLLLEIRGGIGKHLDFRMQITFLWKSGSSE